MPEPLFLASLQSSWVDMAESPVSIVGGSISGPGYSGLGFFCSLVRGTFLGFFCGLVRGFIL